jgi:hypothetical protein
LDGLNQEYARMRDRISARDKQTIDAHLDHLAALEKQLDNLVVCTPPVDVQDPSSELADLSDRVAKLHVELIVAALRCGLSNVAALEVGDLLTTWLPNGNLTGFGNAHSFWHHAREIGPTGSDPGGYDDWMAQALEIQQWRMSMVAQLLEGLDDPAFLEGDNTVLDNSLVLVTTEFSAASKHIAANQPILLAGGAGAGLPGGRYIDYNVHAAADPYTFDYETNESLHNLFVSVLHLFGQDDTEFGSADASHQGPLPGLV